MYHVHSTRRFFGRSGIERNVLNREANARESADIGRDITTQYHRDQPVFVSCDVDYECDYVRFTTRPHDHSAAIARKRNHGIYRAIIGAGRVRRWGRNNVTRVRGMPRVKRTLVTVNLVSRRLVINRPLARDRSVFIDGR